MSEKEPDDAKENVVKNEGQELDSEVTGEATEGEHGETQQGEEYQEADEEGEYEGEAEEEESILTLYDPDDYISGAVTSPQTTIPADIFQFEYPFHAITLPIYELIDGHRRYSRSGYRYVQFFEEDKS
ncbi:unnamed protein product [Spodoptera exigua]|nr:unnamed protein product [Spodoptera exigua]